MARHGLSAVVCAGVVFGALCPLGAAPREEAVKDRLLPQLEVQKVLEAGLAHLQAGKFKDAVQVLEQKVHLIDGNREYLRALRDAYVGHLTQLKSADRAKDARDLRAKLAILDPTFQRELPVSGPVSAVPSTAAPTNVAVRPGAGPTTPAGGMVSRGKLDEVDPFADSNSVESHKARALVAQAERAYAEKKYETANRLFAQAHQAMPAETKASRERWAYSKLAVVAQAINRGGSDMVVAPELERQVREALAMAPKLEKAGNTLLREMREQAPKIEVKHTPRKGTGWALAETTNFRIFHAQTTEQAERAAKAAETARTTLARKWLGEALPAWSPRCDVYLHPTATDYAKATSAPESNPGHSTISMEMGRVVARRIDLRADHKAMIEATLVHETTHVVVAGKFGRHQVPRWADEGMAVLSEPRERIDMHLRNLPAHRRDGQLFGIGKLLGMENYPEARFVGPFYAQSVSLVEFLVVKKDAQTFTRFLRDGLEGGYEGALRKHYGLAGFAELEQQWRDHAFGARVAAVAEKRR